MKSSDVRQYEVAMLLVFLDRGSIEMEVAKSSFICKSTFVT